MTFDYGLMAPAFAQRSQDIDGEGRDGAMVKKPRRQQSRRCR
jgi:hypothetical protein